MKNAKYRIVMNGYVSSPYSTEILSNGNNQNWETMHRFKTMEEAEKAISILTCGIYYDDKGNRL